MDLFPEVVNSSSKSIQKAGTRETTKCDQNSHGKDSEENNKGDKRTEKEITVSAITELTKKGGKVQSHTIRSKKISNSRITNHRGDHFRPRSQNWRRLGLYLRAANTMKDSRNVATLNEAHHQAWHTMSESKDGLLYTVSQDSSILGATGISGKGNVKPKMSSEMKQVMSSLDKIHFTSTDPERFIAEELEGEEVQLTDLSDSDYPEGKSRFKEKDVNGVLPLQGMLQQCQTYTLNKKAANELSNDGRRGKISDSLISGDGSNAASSLTNRPQSAVVTCLSKGETQRDTNAGDSKIAMTSHKIRKNDLKINTSDRTWTLLQRSSELEEKITNVRGKIGKNKFGVQSIAGENSVVEQNSFSNEGLGTRYTSSQDHRWLEIVTTKDLSTLSEEKPRPNQRSTTASTGFKTHVLHFPKLLRCSSSVSSKNL